MKSEHANAFVGQKLAAALLMADLGRKKAPK